MIQASGYGNYGASRGKKSLKGWTNTAGSANEDIHANLDTLRTRSRDLTMGVPMATAAIKTYRTNVIGSGLTPKPTIDAAAAGLSEEQARKLEKQITREFALWADSPNCDSERVSTFYELQQLIFSNWLMSGDVFVLMQEKQRTGCPYTFCLQVVEADRVSTPGNLTGIDVDEQIIQGVETDETGEVVAYHISKRHPHGYLTTRKMEWMRVEAWGKRTGRRNVLHVTTKERIGQRRGVPLLAPVIESLKQMGRYMDAEQVAAVVNGIVAVFIQQESMNTAPLLGEEEQGPPDALADAGDERSIELGAGTVFELRPGETVNTVAPGRPNTNFDGFISAIAKQIGAALELPVEVLLKQFTNNYSASRAALLEAWKAFQMWRDWMVEKFCQPVYEEWMTEAVARGRLSLPGYWGSETIRKAVSNAQWYGPAQGQLDPVKEVTAAGLRIQYGFSNHAKEAMELTGTDFDENIKTIEQENQRLKEATRQDETPVERNRDEQ